MHVSIHVSMYVFMHVCIHVSMFVYMYLCMYVFVCGCRYLCIEHIAIGIKIIHSAYSCLCMLSGKSDGQPKYSGLLSSCEYTAFYTCFWQNNISRAWDTRPPDNIWHQKRGTNTCGHWSLWRGRVSVCSYQICTNEQLSTKEVTSTLFNTTLPNMTQAHKRETMFEVRNRAIRL